MWISLLSLLACTPKASDTGPTVDSEGWDLGCDYYPNVEVYGSVTYEDGSPVEVGVVTFYEDEGTADIEGGRYEVTINDRFEDPLTVEITAADEAQVCGTAAPTVLVAAACSRHQVDLVLELCEG